MLDFTTIKLTEKELSRLNELFVAIGKELLPLPKGKCNNLINKVRQVRLILEKGKRRK